MELIREGAKITSHLIRHGPLPTALADSWLPTAEDRAKGMVRYFAERDYDLEVNAAGDIVGAGISLIADEKSEGHISVIEDRRFYNWCVCDIVMFPMVMQVRSDASTLDPRTGEKISWTVTPDRFENVSQKPRPRRIRRSPRRRCRNCSTTPANSPTCSDRGRTLSGPRGR